MSDSTNTTAAFKVTNQSLRTFAVKLLKEANIEFSRQAMSELIYANTQVTMFTIRKALRNQDYEFKAAEKSMMIFASKLTRVANAKLSEEVKQKLITSTAKTITFKVRDALRMKQSDVVAVVA